MLGALNIIAIVFGVLLMLKKVAEMDLPYYVRVVGLTVIITCVALYLLPLIAADLNYGCAFADCSF
jgi:hypothetical protein